MALSLGLSLSIPSCSDNDLADGNNNGGNGTIHTEAEAQKYETLQTLLGALANVDSLPDNWNSSNYTVLPTVGVVKDEAEAHVRYVVTSSQKEADRIYRSYLSKDVTGTPTNDSWQQDGIGSMQFTLDNANDSYATLKVNVQQIPTLEEIRFVSADALGNNGLNFLKPSGCYYSFGDVIYQEKGGQPTLWVCVRPCSKEESLRKSHWCTFQLVPANKNNEDANFVKISKNHYLPNELSYNKSDAERMVQNFFNVLRLISNPEIVQDTSFKYKGLGEIKAAQFTYDDIRSISYIWNYLDLWNKDRSISSTLNETNKELETKIGVVNNKYSTTLENLKQYLSKGEYLNAYYYDYKKSSWYNKGDYNVYNLRFPSVKSGLYDKVQKQTYYVLENEIFDFRDYESGKTDKSLYIYSTNSDTPEKSYQFIVKHRTGAELEEADQDIDVDPAHSFSLRKDNGISDILVSGLYRKQLSFPEDTKDQTNDEPFFSFGDVVDETKKVNSKSFTGNAVCVKNASRESRYLTDEARNAWFVINKPNQESYIPKGITRVTINDNAAKIILYHLLNGYMHYKHQNLTDGYYLTPTKMFENDSKCNRAYIDGSDALYLACEQGIKLTEDDNHQIILQTNLNGQGYQLVYEYQKDREGADFDEVLKFSKANGDFGNLTIVSYKDEHRFYEDFSASKSLNGVTKDERKTLKAKLSEYNENLLSTF